MKRLLPITLVLAGLALWLWVESSPGRAQEPAPAAARPTPERSQAANEVVAESTPSAVRVPLDVAAEPVEAEQPELAPAPGPPEAANGWFYGLAVDALSGLPIAGARAIVPRGEARPPPDQLTGDAIASEAVSDERGLFRLALASRRDVGRALLLAAGYGAGAFVFSPDNDAPERAELIELLPSAELEVRVIDLDGRPQPTVGVEVSWPAESAIRSGGSSILSGGVHARWSAATTEDGLVRFAGLPAETTLLWRLVDRVHEGRFALAPHEQRRIEVVLGAGARIHGRVRDERGVPVAGLELRLAPPGTPPREGSVTEVPLPGARARKRRLTCRTDDQGRYEFDEVPFETFEIVAGSMSELVLVGDTTVTIDRLRVELDLIATTGLFISGRIVGMPEGDRTEFLTVKRADGTRVLSDHTRDETFRVGPLAPGDYLLQAGSGESGSAIARAAAGATDVELLLAPVRELSIRVAGARGAYDVAAIDLDRGVTRYWTQDSGSIRLVWAHGAHALLLTTLDGRIGVLPHIEVDGEHPSGDLAIALEPGAHVIFVHRATGGVRTLRVRVAGEPFPLPYPLRNALTAGASAALVLPAGALEVELVEHGRVVAREEAQLFAGERRRIVLVPQ